MLCGCTITNVIEPTKVETEAYKAAGCLFTDGKFVLAGYQQKRGTSVFSGIGGSKKEGETYIDTALRETVEELLEIYDLPKKVYDDLKAVSPRRVCQLDSYVNVIYSFEDLDRFLLIIGKAKKLTKLYKSFPASRHELIYGRNISGAVKSEISYLMLVPLISHDLKGPFIDQEFLKDLSIVKALMSPTRFIHIN